MKTLSTIGAAFFLVLTTAPASAAPWTVDYAKSHITFSVVWSHEPLKGEFKSWKAGIDFDTANLAQAHADVSVDMGSATTGDGEIDGAIQGGLGFGTADYPTARFQTLEIVSKGGFRYQAAAQLTLKGITKPLDLPFTLTFNGNSAHVVGTAHLIRTEFNVGGGEYASDKVVSHDVIVSVDLTARKGR